VNSVVQIDTFSDTGRKDFSHVGEGAGWPNAKFDGGRKLGVGGRVPFLLY
jgi:hypothetical protein